MDPSYLHLFIKISFILIHNLLETTTVAKQDFLAFDTSGGNYTINSTYQSNLNLLLSYFSHTEVDNGFYNFTAGQEPNKVFGIALCRGDIAQDVCRSCVNETSHRLALENFPQQKGAIGWYDYCMSRYSDGSILGTVSPSSVYFWNNPNVSNVDEFSQALGKLMGRLRDQAPLGGSLRKFATDFIPVTNFQKIYALVQCTPDLSQLQCSNCLDEAIGKIPIYCAGKPGGRIIGPSCNLRFDTEQFYETTPPPPPPSIHLQSPPPFIPPPSTNTSATKGKEKNTSRTIIIILVPIIISVILLVCIWVFLRLRKSRQKVDSISVESLQFSFNVIRAATDNFSEANKLGQGGFGAVYRGRLSNGNEIAVKRLSIDSNQGDHEFRNEVLLLANLKHRNLVRLLGFCLKGNEKLLVYEFLPNASLDHLIFNRDRRADLDWEKRYNIIGGTARGLVYLHEDAPDRIIHRDLKAGNILLDAKMNPKIADFGMAKLFKLDQTQANTNKIVGTYGYMAPEYAMQGGISVKLDVYSFGVLILEIVSGQRNVGENIETLISRAWRNWREETATNLIDPMLTGSRTEIMRCIHIGLLCVQESVAARPTMNEVVRMLNSTSLTFPVPSHPAATLVQMINSNTFTLPVPSQPADAGLTESSVYEDTMTELYPQ